MGEGVQDVDRLPDHVEAHIALARFQPSDEFRSDARDDGVAGPRCQVVNLVGRRCQPHFVNQVEPQQPLDRKSVV